MQLRHISPGSSDWVDAMDEGGGGRGWEKLAPEERSKLRVSEFSSVWGRAGEASEIEELEAEAEAEDYGWGGTSASR
jgi:hypothetical protein